MAHAAQPRTNIELLALRRCVNRGTPYGGERWTWRTATALGLESTFRPRGPENQACPLCSAIDRIGWGWLGRC